MHSNTLSFQYHLCILVNIESAKERNIHVYFNRRHKIMYEIIQYSFAVRNFHKSVSCIVDIVLLFGRLQRKTYRIVSEPIGPHKTGAMVRKLLKLVCLFISFGINILHFPLIFTRRQGPSTLTPGCLEFRLPLKKNIFNHIGFL